MNYEAWLKKMIQECWKAYPEFGQEERGRIAAARSIFDEMLLMRTTTPEHEKEE